jgi:hypothetical protein
MTSMFRLFVLTLLAILAVGTSAQAQAPSRSSKGTVAWTVAGAAGGFGIGLWAGLTKVDDQRLPLLAPPAIEWLRNIGASRNIVVETNGVS